MTTSFQKVYEKTMPALSAVFLQWRGMQVNRSWLLQQLSYEIMFFSLLSTQLPKHTAALHLPTTLPVEPLELRHLHLLREQLAGHEA